MTSRAAVFACCVALAVVPGCSKIAEDVGKKAARQAISSVTTPLYAPSAVPSAVRGVETTIPGSAPPRCDIAATAKGRPVTVPVTDLGAPRIVISVPPGWTTTPGDDPALRLTGPDGMTGTVRITATGKSPGEAFTAYLDELRASLGAGAPSISVDVQRAWLCGYSSQRITGSAGDVVFADRIAHIWTNTANYLVAVHVQGRKGTPGFDAATAVLAKEFSVTIP